MEEGLETARIELEELEKIGISMKKVTQEP